MTMKGRISKAFRWEFILLLSLIVALRAPAQTLMTDSFEGFALDDLDANGSVGLNSAPNRGANPWFGPFPPNFSVVNGENGITPHSGTNMIRGANSFDLEYYNIAYRLNGSNAFSGSLVLDWWFYDPIGTTNFGTYQDTVGIGSFDSLPLDADYFGDPNTAPGPALQLLSLGASPDQDGSFDGSRYQALILGADGGYDVGSGWYNTSTLRSIGWHHGRIQVSPLVTNTTTIGTFYIDDMATPTLVQDAPYASGYNALELKSRYGHAIGYFDEISLSKAAIPALELLSTGGNLVLSWPAGWTLQSSTNLSALNSFMDIPGATSPYTNTPSSGNLFFRLKN